MPRKYKSNWLNCLRPYLRKNTQYFYALPPNLLEIVNEYVLAQGIKSIPNPIIQKLVQAANFIFREKRKQLSLKKKADYIEALDLHNSHPKLYAFCKRMGIGTIHSLDSFVQSLGESEGRTDFLRTYPEAYELINYYERNRKLPNASSLNLHPKGESSP